MLIREARNTDSDTIKQLVFSVLREYGLKPDPASTDKDLDNIEEQYFHPGGFFAIVEIDHIIVATMGLHPVDDSTCELRKMYCLPQCRGRGLGRRLMEFALTKARELGFRPMILETASPLKEAIGLYSRFGFQPYVPAHFSARCDQAFERYI
jgi:putative acetyltransferase